MREREREESERSASETRLFDTLVRAPRFLSQAGEGSGPWAEYPGCWGEPGVDRGVTGTMYTDVGSRGVPITQLYHHPPAPESSKGGYESRPPEDVYEDPDGLKLVSFGGHVDRM